MCEIEWRVVPDVPMFGRVNCKGWPIVVFYGLGMMRKSYDGMCVRQ